MEEEILQLIKKSKTVNAEALNEAESKLEEIIKSTWGEVKKEGCHETVLFAANKDPAVKSQKYRLSMKGNKVYSPDGEA